MSCVVAKSWNSIGAALNANRFRLRACWMRPCFKGQYGGARSPLQAAAVGLIGQA